MKFPFEATDDSTLEENITKGSPNLEYLKLIGYSQNVSNLINKLLQKNVDLRLKMSTSLNHNWFKKGGQGIDSLISKQQLSNVLSQPTEPLCPMSGRDAKKNTNPKEACLDADRLEYL